MEEKTFDKIQKLMDERKVTAYQLSKELGITQSLFSHWKSGFQKPKTDAIAKIAKYFNVSTDYLLGLTEVKTPVNELAKNMSAAEPVMKEYQITFENLAPELQDRAFSYMKGLESGGKEISEQTRERKEKKI